MRTTLSIDDDVLEKAKATAGKNLDNIQDLLAQIEGEDSR